MNSRNKIKINVILVSIILLIGSMNQNVTPTDNNKQNENLKDSTLDRRIDYSHKLNDENQLLDPLDENSIFSHDVINVRMKDQLLKKVQLQEILKPKTAIGPAYIPQNSIYITGNDDFVNQASTNGWFGNGTANSPYIIEGSSFINSGYGDSIFIQNVNLYFEIRSNYFEGGFSAVYMSNTQNGRIYNNTIQNVNYAMLFNYVSNTEVITNNINNSYYGMRMYSSDGITISYNTIDNTDKYGILSSYSSSLIITGNQVSNSLIDIDIYNSNNNTIMYNTMFGGGLRIRGFSLYDTIQASVSSNTINGRPVVYWQNVVGGTVPAGAGQVILVNTSFVEVVNQVITDVAVGISALYGQNLNINNNIITGGFLDFYELGNSTISSNTLSGNSAYSNRILIQFSVSENNTITSNTLVGGGFNFWSEKVHQSLVTGNTVNGKPVVYWQDVTGGVVPTGAGQIILIHTVGVEISNQIINNAGIGIQIFSSLNVKILNNVINNDKFDLDFLSIGIDLFKSNFSIISGNQISNSLYNLYLYKSDNNDIFNNNIISSLYNYVEQFSERNQIYNNNFYDAFFFYISSSYSSQYYHNLMQNISYILIRYSTSIQFFGNDLFESSISPFRSNQGQIFANKISNAGGIAIDSYYSNDNTISENLIFNSSYYGIRLSNSYNNTITYNTISYGSDYGLSISQSNQTDVLYNNFINNYSNGSQVYIEDNLIASFVNNYWSEWTSPDNNNDGIVDNPYYISMNHMDYAPSVDPKPVIGFPEIDSPQDITLEYGSTNGKITWVPFGELPDVYNIYQNGSIVSTGFWVSGVEIVLNLATQNVGHYNFTIVISNTRGYSTSDTVFVTILPSSSTSSSTSTSTRTSTSTHTSTSTSTSTSTRTSTLTSTNTHTTDSQFSSTSTSDRSNETSASSIPPPVSLPGFTFFASVSAFIVITIVIKRKVVKN